MPLVHGQHPVFNQEALLNGLTLQAGGVSPIRSNMPRGHAVSDCVAGTTGVLLSVAVPLQVGDLVTNITFVSGATAADTPTHWGFALYDTSATPAKVATSTDKTTTAWAANTVKTLAMTTAYQVTTPGVYYAAMWMAATAVPTLAGAIMVGTALSGAVITGQKVLAQTSGSALTTAAPATIATPTTIVGVPYVVVN